jgi:hypothetical protein
MITVSRLYGNVDLAISLLILSSLVTRLASTLVREGGQRLDHTVYGCKYHTYKGLTSTLPFPTGCDDDRTVSHSPLLLGSEQLFHGSRLITWLLL